MLLFHHIGIETDDLDNSLRWYRDFFDARPSWSLETFSELTHRRLPGIARLTELVVDDLRIHLMERPGPGGTTPGERRNQFQHVCLAAGSGDELRRWRARWLDLFASGRYTFACDDQPTEIVLDADGSRSFYALDVNGLEFEFTSPRSSTP